MRWEEVAELEEDLGDFCEACWAPQWVTADGTHHCAWPAELHQEIERLKGAIHTLVADEVISTGKARELCNMSIEQQRKLFQEAYRRPVPEGDLGR